MRVYIASSIIDCQAAFSRAAAPDPAVCRNGSISGGLIFKTTSVAELEPMVLAAAENLAQKPPKALAIARRLIKPDPETVMARMREEAEHFADQLKSAEALTAFQAFMARKK